MKAGRLVRNGEPARAVHCSYEFLPGKIYPGGVAEDDEDFVLDWTGSTANRRFMVQPGAMVWIRVREQVSMPSDLCGLWLQTNTLSRKGLLLINTSLVEPGYDGPLSCHFVNFGKSAVEIYPDTPLVKLLFLKLDASATEPFKRVLDRYDEMVAGLAAHGAKSFLQVSEMSAGLEMARKLAEQGLKNIAELESTKLKSQLELDARQRRLDEIELFKKDVGGYLKRAFGYAFGAIVILGLINYGVQWLGKFASDEAIDQRVERALGKRVTIPGVLVPPQLPSASPSFPSSATLVPAMPSADVNRTQP